MFNLSTDLLGNGTSWCAKVLRREPAADHYFRPIKVQPSKQRTATGLRAPTQLAAHFH